MRLKKFNQKGVSLVELMIAVAILGIMTTSVIMARGFMAKQTIRTNDKAFATEKAIQMFGELKSLVSGSETGINILDNYSDGTTYNTVLTTDKTVDTAPPGSGNAGNALSGNIKTNGHWRYLRQVGVTPLPNDSSARLVTIKLWLYGSDANPTSPPLQPGTILPAPPLAEVGGILRTQTDVYAYTQVMDVYLIDINNIQGWWAELPSLESTINTAISSLTTATNSSLVIRPHYITRTSFGRDAQYAPFINGYGTYSAAATANVGTDKNAMPWVYLYPGLAPQDQPPNGTGTEQYYYEPDDTNSGVLQDGNFNIDGTVSTNGVHPFSVADQYNNSVRYPDELATYKAVTAAYAAAGVNTTSNPATEISERMLIEGMLSEPASFTNAIIVNLHGELIPLPPMRDYSDAAKDPADFPNVRVVTHPENIYYPTSATTASVTLRVYGYMDGFDTSGGCTNVSAANPASMLQDATASQVVIGIPGLDISNPTTLWGSAIYGDAVSNYASYPITANGVAVAPPYNMSMTATSNAGGTTITLTNLPLRHPQAPNGSGLNPADLLYGLEYIPCSPDKTAWGTGVFTSMPLTATSTGSGNPKNTASYTITLPVSVTSTYAPQEIDTYIGGGISGLPNLSKTYVWVGNSSPPPTTEQYQFMGDPRDMPYLDVKVGGPNGGGPNSIVGNGYNWYFKAIPTSTGYQGYSTNTANGWGNPGTSTGVNLNIDLPRFFQMIRNGLFNTTSIWTTVNGWTSFYYGMGGEFGSNEAPYSNGITFEKAPWVTSAAGDTGVTNVDEMITESWKPPNEENYSRVPANVGAGTYSTDSWYAKTWLGELYPDSQYTAYWSTTGNLPTVANAAAATAYFREDFANFVTTGGNTGFHGSGNHLGKAADSLGAISFFDGLNGSDPFQQEDCADIGSPTTIGTITSMGVSCYNIFGYSLPNIVNVTRCWSINAGAPSPMPNEWSSTGYSTHNSLAIPVPSTGVSQIYYTNNTGSSWFGAGAVELTSPTGQQAYIISSGLATSANVGSAALGTEAIIAALRTFLDEGLNTGNDHITQVPLVQVSVDSPTNQYTNPSSVSIYLASPVTNTSGPVTDVWYRFPGLTSTTGNFYTELYPGYPNLLSSSYGETCSLDINFKFSGDGQNWHPVQNPTTTDYQGILDTTNVINTTSMPLTYIWDVSNSTNYPQGDYQLLAEAYRHGFPLHYAWHQVLITIDR